MIIKLKTLKQVEYEVEIDSTNITIDLFKKEVEKKYSFDKSSIKLLYNGNVLCDDKTLSSYHIKEGSVIIIMVSKVIKKNEEKEDKPKETKTEKEITDKNNINTGYPFQTQLNQLLEMGFDQSKCIQALNFAKGSTQIAIEYLYNGIPSQDNYYEQDQNENEEYKEEEYGDEGHFTIPPEVLDQINLQDPNALSSIASVIKILISNNPDSLAELLEEVEETNPEIIDFIKENETQFKNLLTQPITNDDRRVFMTVMGDTFQDPNPQVDENDENDNNDQDPLDEITKDFNDKDRESIMNLVNLGFNEIEAIQAYIACDKNESQAADFLFQDKN